MFLLVFIHLDSRRVWITPATERHQQQKQTLL